MDRNMSAVEHESAESAREAYRAEFSDENGAIEFEHSLLSSGREFLPDFVCTVIDGGESSAAYWRFLTDQIRQVKDEDARELLAVEETRKAREERAEPK